MDGKEPTRLVSEQNEKSVELYLKVEKLLGEYGRYVTARDLVGVLEGLKFNILSLAEDRARSKHTRGKSEPKLGGYT